MHEKLGKKSKRIEPMKVESAKGKLQIKEKIWLKVNFGTYTAKIPFSIIDDPNYQSSLIIIGSDFLKQTDCTIKLAQKSLWIEDEYHVQLYTENKKMTQKLERIKSTLTKCTREKSDENKKNEQKRKTCKHKREKSHKAKQNPSERVGRERKKEPTKTLKIKAQPSRENPSILILQRIEKRESEGNDRTSKKNKQKIKQAQQ